MDLIQVGIIPFPISEISGAPPAETFRILTEASDNLTAENSDLLRTE